MTNPNKQPTCEERIDNSLESAMVDLRAMLRPTREMVTLEDDGTMDIVLSLGDGEFRFSDASYYRDDETGELDLDELLDYEFDSMAETMRERWYEYGLSFDYVVPGTFNDQHRGYFRYQLSWGGPSTEFRFYVDYGGDLERIEYWYLDWWDGASRTVYSSLDKPAPDSDAELLESIWQEFCETGTAELEYKKATD